MLTQISCPACKFQSSIPEGDMGKRQVCSNCKSPFIAGASVPEPLFARNTPAVPAPTYQKTMLGDTSAAIKYNCPRCKAPLEAPSIEAGTKKPCPACGQRLQVPAAPPPAAPLAAEAPKPSLLNKTMLTTDESMPAAPPIKYNCPACKKPLEAPATEALTKKPCPACGQRHQVPAAPLAAARPNPNKTMLVSDGNGPQPVGQPGYAAPLAPGAAPIAPAAPPAGGQIAIGSYTMSTRNFVIAVAAAVFLLLFFGQAVLRGGKSEDPVALAARQREIEKANEEVEQKKAKIEEFNKFVSDQRASFARLEDSMTERYQQAMRGIRDERQRAELQERQDADKAKLDREKAEADRKHQEKLAELKAEADKAAKAAATVVAQPPPVYYYPPYHWRYYSPWGW